MQYCTTGHKVPALGAESSSAAELAAFAAKLEKGVKLIQGILEASKGKAIVKVGNPYDVCVRYDLMEVIACWEVSRRQDVLLL